MKQTSFHLVGSRPRHLWCIRGIPKSNPGLLWGKIRFSSKWNNWDKDQIHGIRYCCLDGFVGIIIYLHLFAFQIHRCCLAEFPDLVLMLYHLSKMSRKAIFTSEYPTFTRGFCCNLNLWIDGQSKSIIEPLNCNIFVVNFARTWRIWSAIKKMVL